MQKLNRPEADFQQVQKRFAARIRDPEHTPLPDDVTAQRMAVYEELIYNNIESLLSSAFPVIRRLHNDEDWHAMVRRFMVNYRAQTPYFSELPYEFVDYLHHSGEQSAFPFLQALAHYEWLELALSIAEQPVLPHFDAEGDLLHDVPLLSPLAWLHSYAYPVHRISPDFIPSEEEQTHLLVYRDLDDEVGFIELNPVTALLIQSLQSNPRLSGETQLRTIAAEIQHPNPDTVIRTGLEILQDLRQRGVVLGTLANLEVLP